MLFAGWMTTLFAVAHADPVALVELYTSEGCSSCPAADLVLNELARGGGPAGVQVVPLAFHVDYWDGLGWADPWGSAEAGERQRTYVRALRLDNGYTPQVVVNGARQFVGSDRGAMARALAQTKERGVAELYAKVGPVAKGRLAVEVSGGLPAGVELFVAITEDGLSSQVLRGENAGRTLAHEAVVRSLGSAEVVAGAAKVELAVPTGVVLERAHVVAWAQDRGSMRVVAAGSWKIGG